MCLPAVHTCTHQVSTSLKGVHRSVHSFSSSRLLCLDACPPDWPACGLLVVAAIMSIKW